MDRSFLSHKQVIEAAKNFVCIRLISYENQAEAEFVSKLVKGPVANTAFAILGPDGTRALAGRGPGRGPRDLFVDADAMAKGMDAVAAKYSAKDTSGTPQLPITLSPKIGLAVAAGDLQPLVVVVEENVEKRASLEAKVAKMAWNSEFMGYYTFASTSTAKQIPNVKGIKDSPGVYIIEPDNFGVGGNLVGSLRTKDIDGRLDGAMRDALKKHARIAKNRSELARQGLEKGIYYETGIPVSGQGEARDRERYKLELERRKKSSGGGSSE